MIYIAGVSLRCPNAVVALVVAAVSCAVAAGCRSGSRPDQNADGSIKFPCERDVCTPDPNGVCQHTCTPDPGPRLVDCAAAEDLKNFDYAKPYIWTFDEPTTPMLARAMYSYTDNTQSIATFFLDGSRKTYQPPTAVMPRCFVSDKMPTVPDNPMNRTIHIQGGPFLAWGGGVGIAMKDHPGRTTDPASPNTFPIAPGPDAVVGAAIDVSAYDGVSFWARRGPDSQVGFRVLVGDKNTDDDIAYRMYRDGISPLYCQRVRECACLNHMPCSDLTVKDSNGMLIKSPDGGTLLPTVCQPPVVPTVMSFCGAPYPLSAGSMGSGAGSATQCNTCNLTHCNEAYPAYPNDYPAPGGVQPTDPVTGALIDVGPLGSDRQFYGKPCSPHTMRNGISSQWCFDPATETPAEQSEQCGDHWTSVVNLSTEWQFYRVPFDKMLQQGWAQRSPKLDLSTVSVVRFTWDGGWIDFWIDDVTFYRHL
jgi:hypothetical protein